MSAEKKKWSVTGAVVGSIYLGEVEAETGEEALEIAGGRAYVSLCHQCSSKCQDPEVEHMTAECGREVVSNEETWEDRARAAGWTPPHKRPVRCSSCNGLGHRKGARACLNHPRNRKAAP